MTISFRFNQIYSKKCCCFSTASVATDGNFLSEKGSKRSFQNNLPFFMSAKLLQQFNKVESQHNQTFKTNSVCASSGKTTGFSLSLHFVFRPALQQAFWQWFAWCLAHTHYSLNRKYSATPVIIEEKVIVRNRLRSWTGQKCELILKMGGRTESNNSQWYVKGSKTTLWGICCSLFLSASAERKCLRK